MINSSSAIFYTHSNYKKSIVYIETDTGSGTGFIVSAGGYCLTCAHVAEDSNEFYVRVADKDGRYDVFKADLFAINKDIDMAVLKLEKGKYQNCALMDIPQREIGNDIVILGYPFGKTVSDDFDTLSLSLTKGYISSWQKRNGLEYALLDISAKAGNSGSPVIDVQSGRVVGILCGSIIQDSGKLREEINYMYPISHFFDYLVQE